MTEVPERPVRASAACLLVSLIVVLAPAAACPARAQDAGPDQPRPVVIVSGERETEYESSLDTTGFTTVIQAGRAWRGYETVGELLDRSVGLRVIHFGGTEDLATVSVRGSGPAQVKILLDGVSLTRASDAVVNLADIPLDAVERIEIYRGVTPVRFASSSASSVINIVTKQIEEPTLESAVSVGSFTTVKGTVSGGAPLGPGTLSGVLTVRHTDGDFEYVDNLGTPENPDDDAFTKRANNDSTSVDVLGRYIAKLRASRLTFTNDVFYKDRGTPGNGQSQAREARFEGLRNIFSTNWQTNDDRFGATFDFTYLDEIIHDPKEADSEEGNTSLNLPYDEADNTTYALALRGRGARAARYGQYLEASLSGGFEQFIGHYPDNDFRDNDESRFSLAVAVGDDVYLERWNLTAALQLRHESLWNDFSGTFAGTELPPELRSDDYEGSIDPRFGLRWDPHPAVSFKGNIGTYFRPPTFRELFGTEGFTVPNPALKPENGFNRDIGFVAQTAQLGPLVRPVLEAAYFDNEIDDLILLVTTGANIPSARNFSKARIRGVELRAAFHLTEDLLVEGNYTHQDGRNESRLADAGGKDLPNLPTNVAYARAVFSQSAWSVSYIFNYQSEVFLESTENLQKQQPGYSTHDLELLFRLGRGGFMLKFQARNLGDAQFFDRWQFPQPGRAFYATLSYAKAEEHES
ncbi:MAG: TonB-dependent receptor [Candidatus Binatia bacterium]